MRILNMNFTQSNVRHPHFERNAVTTELENVCTLHVTYNQSAPKIISQN